MNKIEVLESTLTDQSKVYDVMATTKEARVLFRMAKESEAWDLAAFLRDKVNGIEINFRAVVL